MLAATFGTIVRLTSTALNDRPLRARSDLRVLLYHGVGPNTAPWLHGLSEELDAGIFARQLEDVAAHYDVVPLEDGIRRVLAERPVRPLCAITFDDGLRSVLTAAWPILRARHLPAAVFLNTAAIGNQTLLWQHYVSYAASQVGIETVYAALAARTGWSDPAPAHLVDWCQHRFRDLARIDALRALDALGFDRPAIARAARPYLEWADIDALAGEGVQFYSHTADHLPLAHVDRPTMRDQIDRGLTGLRPPCGRAVVSFPFGMRSDIGSEAREYALTRHRYALEVEDGWNPRRRVREARILRRVALEGRDPRAWHAALEVQPVLKGALNAVRRR